MLRCSKDQRIREDPPEVRTEKRWSAEHEGDRAEAALRQRYCESSAATKERSWSQPLQIILTGSDKEKRDIVVQEVQRSKRSVWCTLLAAHNKTNA